MTRRVRGGAGELKVSLPNPLLNAFNSAIHDPIRGRPQYGRAGSIIEELLRNWLHDNGHPTDLHYGE